ncbi:hypothetical protein BGZ47_000661 [Haplosporangium gracile]|nr:hypothetical protein BGZ47_000661 [Haplosporangium gracile]
MIWCRRAWASIEPTKIKNCFFHTKLFGPSNETPLVDKQLQEARDEIDHNMCLIPPDQRIDVDGFIAPEDENENIHIHLNDAELLALPLDGEGDGEDGEDGDDREDGDEEEAEEQGPPLPTKLEILAAMDITMQYIDGDICAIEYPAEGDTYATTLKALKGWREALHRSILSNMTQPTLTTFFKPT